MSSKFQIFRKAKEMLDKNEVGLSGYKTLPEGTCYFFTVKEYNVTLLISKLNNTKTSIWKREFNCDCRASIRGSQELCSHILACETFLVQNAFQSILKE